jgi:hypothetical protein
MNKEKRKALFLVQMLGALLVCVNATLGIYQNSPGLQRFFAQNVFPKSLHVSNMRVGYLPVDTQATKFLMKETQLPGRSWVSIPTD